MSKNESTPSHWNDDEPGDATPPTGAEFLSHEDAGVSPHAAADTAGEDQRPEARDDPARNHFSYSGGGSHGEQNVKEKKRTSLYANLGMGVLGLVVVAGLGFKFYLQPRMAQQARMSQELFEQEDRNSRPVSPVAEGAVVAPGTQFASLDDAPPGAPRTADPFVKTPAVSPIDASKAADAAIAAATRGGAITVAPAPVVIAPGLVVAPKPVVVAVVAPAPAIPLVTVPVVVPVAAPASGGMTSSEATRLRTRIQVLEAQNKALREQQAVAPAQVVQGVPAVAVVAKAKPLVHLAAHVPKHRAPVKSEENEEILPEKTGPLATLSNDGWSAKAFYPASGPNGKVWLTRKGNQGQEELRAVGVGDEISGRKITGINADTGVVSTASGSMRLR